MLFQITVMVLQTPKGAFKKIKLEFKPSTLVKSFSINVCVGDTCYDICFHCNFIYFVLCMFFLLGGIIEINK